MRKIVFKGIINGKEFDNVQDYNKEMNRLLSEGSSRISASSSTQMIDEPKQEETQVEPIKEFCKEDYLPFFSDTSDQHYLDLLVSNDEKLNEKNLNITKQEFNRKIDNLKEILAAGNIDIEDAFDLINDLKEVRDEINNDGIGNHLAIEDLKGRIKKATDNLQILENSNPVIKLFSEYYNKVFELVREYLLKY